METVHHDVLLAVVVLARAQNVIRADFVNREVDRHAHVRNGLPFRAEHTKLRVRVTRNGELHPEQSFLVREDRAEWGELFGRGYLEKQLARLFAHLRWADEEHQVRGSFVLRPRRLSRWNADRDRGQTFAVKAVDVNGRGVCGGDEHSRGRDRKAHRASERPRKASAARQYHLNPEGVGECRRLGSLGVNEDDLRFSREERIGRSLRNRPYRALPWRSPGVTDRTRARASKPEHLAPRRPE